MASKPLPAASLPSLASLPGLQDTRIASLIVGPPLGSLSADLSRASSVLGRRFPIKHHPIKHPPIRQSNKSNIRQSNKFSNQSSSNQASRIRGVHGSRIRAYSKPLGFENPPTSPERRACWSTGNQSNMHPLSKSSNPLAFPTILPMPSSHPSNPYS